MQITARHWGIAIAAAVILEVAAAVWLMPSLASPSPPAGGEGIEISLALAGAAGNPGAPALEPVAVPQPAPMAIPEPVTPKPVKPKPVKPKPIKPKPAKTPPPKPTPAPQKVAAPVTRPDSETPAPADSTPAAGDLATANAARDTAAPAASAADSGGGGATGAAGAGIAGAEVNYYSQLAAALNRHKRYPYAARRARQEGVVRLRFVIDNAGNVIEQGIAGTSGYPALDQAVLEMLRRASPLPAIPEQLGRDQLAIVLPIEFSLRRD